MTHKLSFALPMVLCIHKFYNLVTLSYGVDTLSVFPCHYGMSRALQETSYGATIQRKKFAVIRDT